MNQTISTDESADEDEVFRDFDSEAQLIVQKETLPKKSADRYMLVYETYKGWKNEHQCSLSSSEESNLIVYFKDLSKKLKPSTLWSILSMLKKTLNTRDNIDISRFQNLKCLIKNNSKGYKPKKSLVLKWDDIVQFMNNASDFIYLASKVILVFGICGALRCDELTNLKVQDIEDLGNKYLVSIHETKNDKPRQFIIGDLFYGKIKQYTTLRPVESFTDRFFINYQKGKCYHQVIGRNKIGETPQAIASFLNLPNPKMYTGHCFRRTGATLLSDSGANITMLKQLGGWQSTNIAQGYVENSIKNKEKIFESITHAGVSNPQSNQQPSTSKLPSAKSVTDNADKNPKTTKMHWNNCFEDLEISDDELIAIDQLDQSNLESLTPRFTTAKKSKIFVRPSNNRAEHFTTKSPLKLLFKRSTNEPPTKKSKTEEPKSDKERKLPPSSKLETENQNDLETMFKNPYVKYENCVFHGNIINHFHPS